MSKGKVTLKKCLLVSRITKDNLHDIDCDKEIFQEPESNHKIIWKKGIM